MDLLTALQEWYALQCDGVWEHQHGIRVESCDNPGWWVKIDLAGTQLKNRSFAPLKQGIDNNGHPLGSRWLSCYTVEDVWNGAGDETKLQIILQTFLDWATNSAA